MALRRFYWVVFCFLTISFLFSASFISTNSSAASSSDFANANAAINSAFSAVNSAEQSGGNVSSLLAKLEISLGLVQKAEVENSTDPLQATADLQNATQLADQVLSQAPAIAQQGASSRETLYEESIGSSIAILVIAMLIYVYGGRIYHLTWFFLYRNHLVRSGEENG